MNYGGTTTASVSGSARVVVLAALLVGGCRTPHAVQSAPTLTLPAPLPPAPSASNGGVLTAVPRPAIALPPVDPAAVAYLQWFKAFEAARRQDAARNAAALQRLQDHIAGQKYQESSGDSNLSFSSGNPELTPAQSEQALTDIDARQRAIVEAFRTTPAPLLCRRLEATYANALTMVEMVSQSHAEVMREADKSLRAGDAAALQQAMTTKRKIIELRGDDARINEAFAAAGAELATLRSQMPGAPANLFDYTVGNGAR